ncbi:MAG: translation factor Sua5 [Flaviaesturariibacter sp.]|nr:translation factor Sua5 [Flaviaesturariibacter sp.]
MAEIFEDDIKQCIQLMERSGVILYPTDTIWGLGCDATDATAVQKIYNIKKRADSKSLIILVAEERDILHYVAAPDPAVFLFLEDQTKPTTVIFNGAIGLPDNLIAADGSVAIRVVHDKFCRHLIKRLRKPLVSTSANISGEQTAAHFLEVSNIIKDSADYIVKWRQDDRNPSQPSQIIRWKENGNYDVIRP